MRINTRTQPTARSGRWLLNSLALFASLLLLSNAQAQESVDTQTPLLPPDQLEILVAPVALYPDDLLAVVLPAATYPLQVVEASRFLQAREDDTSLEPDPEWDDAIVALLNYPEIVDLLNEDLDWTWQLGEAFIAQQADLLEAVEVYRDQAYLAGNLRSDDYQTVSRREERIIIEPADPEVIYVPYYDPVTVVVRQPSRAFFYYDRPYPLYYYPYAAGHRFYNGFFWGVSTAFSISWADRFLHLRYYDHYRHPFYGRYRSTRYFYRHRSSHDYRVYSRGTRHHVRQNRFRWYPSRYAGNRPGFHHRYRHSDRRVLRYSNDNRRGVSRYSAQRRDRAYAENRARNREGRVDNVIQRDRNRSQRRSNDRRIANTSRRGADAGQQLQRQNRGRDSNANRSRSQGERANSDRHQREVRRFASGSQRNRDAAAQSRNRSTGAVQPRERREVSRFTTRSRDATGTNRATNRQSTARSNERTRRVERQQQRPATSSRSREQRSVQRSATRSAAATPRQAQRSQRAEPRRASRSESRSTRQARPAQRAERRSQASSRSTRQAPRAQRSASSRSSERRSGSSSRRDR
ncbi:MAG: DUF3300 domain-containing protein [Pseudomonadota bacterium]